MKHVDRHMTSQLRVYFTNFI